MKNKKIDTLYTVMISVCTLLIFIGAFLQLQHFKYGNTIALSGLVLNALLSGLYIRTLKFRIKELEVKNIK